MNHCFYFIITCLAVIKPDYMVPERKLAFTGDKPCYVKQVMAHCHNNVHTLHCQSERQVSLSPTFLVPNTSQYITRSQMLFD